MKLTAGDSINKSELCLLLLYPVINAAGGGLMGPEQANRTSPVRIQHVSRFIPHHQVQTQNPEQARGSKQHQISLQKQF